MKQMQSDEIYKKLSYVIEEDDFSPAEILFSDNVDKYPRKGQEDLKSDRYEQDTGQRKFLARTTMYLIVVWLMAILVIIVGTGTGILKLTDNLLIALLCTTTANVLGLSVIVLNGFFKNMKQDVEF